MKQSSIALANNKCKGSQWLFLRTAVAIALLLTFSAGNVSAQPGPPSAELETTLSRLAGMSSMERNSASIDAELAARHNRRGNTYNNLERFDDAITEYNLSIAADPNHADSIRNLANIYYFQERFSDVIPLLARFIRLQTELSTPLVAAQHTLGQLLRDANRYDEAIEVDLRAIELEPHNDSQIYVMGNTYLNAGRTDLAVRVYEKGVEIIPANAFLYRTLGRIYEQEQRLEEALQQYRAAAELDTGSQFYKDLVTNLEARLNP